jgi:hypothetical protein
MKLLRLVAVAAALVVLSQTAFSLGLSESRFLSHQFRVTNNLGQPISGTLYVKYRFYVDSVGGSSLYTAYDTVVADAQGFVTTSIDRGLPGPPIGPIPQIHDSLPNFIEVELNGQVLSRSRLTPVMYASGAQNLRGGFVTTGPGGLAAYPSDLATVPAFRVKLDSIGQTSNISISDAVYSTKTVIWPDAMSIGQGAGDSTHPSEALLVGGPARISYDGGPMVIAPVDPWVKARMGMVIASVGADSWGRSGADSAGIYLSANTSDYSIISSKTLGGKTALRMSVGDDPDDNILLMPSGNVGISDSTPSQKLTVSGTVYSKSGGFKFPDGSIQTTASFGGGGSSPWQVSGLNITADTIDNYSVGINTTTPNSPLQVDGAVATAYTTTNTPFGLTLGPQHSIVAVAITSGFSETINLPSAVGIAGRQYTIKRTVAGIGSVTVDASGTQTIDGALTYSLPTQWKYVVVVSDGANWLIVGNN